LGAADNNPSILSYITMNNNNTFLNSIDGVPSTTSIIQNTAQPIGFFSINTGATTFITDPDHVKQPDLMVKLNTVNGGNNLKLYKSPKYGGNLNSPAIGDLILIKWTNPSGNTNTTGYTVNNNYPTPYLIYRITAITGYTNNSLIANINVDRNLPDFTGYAGNICAGALIYYNYINYTGDTIYNYYSTDYLNQSVITFLENCQCPTIRFPFWNMSIVFTEEIAGVKTTNKQFTQFNTRQYGGFVSYIQNQAAIIKKLGIIHYTNSSPSNTYGEEFYQNTPTLYIPTIMWHKSSNKQLGVILKAYGSVKILSGPVISGITTGLNTTYYDLADLNGNIVGKIFNDLKLFTIEDQELLFAMSYKSNRSWTLPNYSVDVNNSVVYGCPDCTVTFNVAVNNPTVNGGTGRLIISNIQNTVGIAPDVDLILLISGATYGKVYSKPITGNTYVYYLYPDTYNVTIYDLRASTSTCIGQTVIMTGTNSLLAISGLTSTGSGLNPDFTITINSPTSITIPENSIGTYYGTPTVGYELYGTSNLTNFVFDVPLNALTFKQAYTFVVKDTIIGSPNTVFSVSKDYVAVGSPFNSTFLTSRGSDTGGTYVYISGYLTTINQNINPIIGNIEFMVVDSGYPSSWVSGLSDGSAMKIYCSTNQLNIYIRENYLGITAAEVNKIVPASGSTGNGNNNN
jgi:hypothetical protein